jgi:hypothetical protein
MNFNTGNYDQLAGLFAIDDSAPIMKVAGPKSIGGSCAVWEAGPGLCLETSRGPFGRHGSGKYSAQEAAGH